MIDIGPVFLDTSYFIALTNAGDRHHQVALAAKDDLLRRDIPCTTSAFVLVELLDGLARLRRRSLGLAIVDEILADDALQVAAASERLFGSGLQRYRERADKEWGLTDCTSFVVMEERGISAALTADRHFAQAGFRALLLEAGA